MNIWVTQNDGTEDVAYKNDAVKYRVIRGSSITLDFGNLVWVERHEDRIDGAKGSN